MENLRAHLAMIQGVINRLSHNSFLLKGWSVLLVSALFALAAKDSNPQFVYLAYFPAIAFWALDGYFLRQERLFRALYDETRTHAGKDTDFSMSTLGVASRVDSWGRVTMSKTLVGFHGVLVAAILFVGLISR